MQQEAQRQEDDRRADRDVRPAARGANRGRGSCTRTDAGASRRSRARSARDRARRAPAGTGRPRPACSTACGRRRSGRTRRWGRASGSADSSSVDRPRRSSNSPAPKAPSSSRNTLADASAWPNSGADRATDPALVGELVARPTRRLGRLARRDVDRRRRAHRPGTAGRPAGSRCARDLLPRRHVALQADAVDPPHDAHQRHPAGQARERHEEPEPGPTLVPGSGTRSHPHHGADDDGQETAELRLPADCQQGACITSSARIRRWHGSARRSASTRSRASDRCPGR